jgi:hypothetical protein
MVSLYHFSNKLLFATDLLSQLVLPFMQCDQTEHANGLQCMQVQRDLVGAWASQVGKTTVTLISGDQSNDGCWLLTRGPHPELDYGMRAVQIMPPLQGPCLLTSSVMSVYWCDGSTTFITI